MSVDDNWGEALRKSAIQIVPGDKTEYAFRVAANDSPISTLNPLPVTIVPPANTVIKEYSDEALAVSAALETPLLSYTVQPGIAAVLQRLDYSGTNVSKYNYYKNDDLVHWKLTAFGAPLSGSFDLDGVPLVEGDKIDLKVIHSRPFAADYSARLQILETTLS